MSTMALRSSTWPLYAVPAAALLSVLGMLLAGLWHAQIGRSALVDTLVAASFIAALGGAIGGLVLANTRRNVMWILAVAVSMTALLALLALILASLAE